MIVSCILLTPAVLSLCFGQTAGAAPPFDPGSWKLGGLRGTVVGPASDQYPFQSEGTTVKLKDGTPAIGPAPTTACSYMPAAG